MKTWADNVAFWLLTSIFFAVNAPASVLYVDLNCASPTPPYTDWSTAATNIQDAVDASTNGDLILVTNGIYKSGGRFVSVGSGDTTKNSVAVTKPVTVQSINGSALTAIDGGHTMRCAYLTNGGVLTGFTLTNGYAGTGGGVYCVSTSSVVWNCVLINNSAANYIGPNGGGAYSGTLNNCILTGNSATDGGAAYGNSTFLAILNNCTVSNNWANSGGGASGGPNGYGLAAPGANSNCILNNCFLIGNHATNYGGGAHYCTLNNCTILNNSTIQASGTGPVGGGVEHGTLNNCLLASNSVSAGKGGGADSSTLSNCLITGNFTIITGGSGGGAENSTLINCTLSSNSTGGTDGAGGGADISTLRNCILTGNFSGDGGGAKLSFLTNCLVVSNTALYGGGGVEGGTLVNCTVIGNSQTVKTISPPFVHGGGGIFGSIADNCIIYYNSSINGSSNYFYYPTSILPTLTNCCTYPPTNGVNNITNEPLFIDFAGGNYHLQPNSRCINAGYNSYILNTIDLDGNPRKAGGTVDMGAYEYQLQATNTFVNWLQKYNLSTNGAADFADADGDGMNDLQEWLAGTIPTNAASVLKLLSPSNNVSGVKVSWQSVTNVIYYLQSSTNLSTQPAFFSIQSNLVGQAVTTCYTDITATNGGPYFYRIGVQ